MRKKMNYDFLECLKKMPPLRHSFLNRDFDIMKSEVAIWISNQPSVMLKLFDIARYHKVITYNPETGKWKGVNYNGD